MIVNLDRNKEKKHFNYCLIYITISQQAQFDERISELPLASIFVL